MYLLIALFGLFISFTVFVIRFMIVITIQSIVFFCTIIYWLSAAITRGIMR